MSASRTSTAAALTAMSTAVLTSFVVAALYVARDLLIPLALAALLTFLLAPLVSRVERWIGRVAGALTVVFLVFAVLGFGGYVLTQQILELATKLPDYQGNMETKLKSLKMPGGGRFTRLSKTFDELKKDMPGAASDAAPTVNTKPDSDIPVAAPHLGRGSGRFPMQAVNQSTPVQVEVVEQKKAGLAEGIGAIIAPVVGPLGTAALVLLLVICMLLQREDLRGRLIRLIGTGNISATTRAMDDAASRVARYLFMQLIVNVTYGIAVTVGLYFIGVPNSPLWGVFATVLRFIPYIGPWMAAGFPAIMALAVSTTWTMPLLTVGLFLLIELLCNNALEPLLYGSSTGVSSIALILAAVFWTWLWGMPGLVLATPLTVCLVVMGRHVPKLAFLSVLLSDERALSPAEECYHRLLTPDMNDAQILADTFRKDHTQAALCDEVLIPALIAIERDFQIGSLDEEQRNSAHQELRDIVDDLASRPIADPPASTAAGDAAAASPAAPTVPTSPLPGCRVLSLPVRAERDETTGVMLTQLLRAQGMEADSLSAKSVTGELIEAVEREAAEAVCVSVVPPSTIVQARYVCSKLRARYPKVHIIVGLWGATDDLVETVQRLRSSGADEVVTTLAEAVTQFSKTATLLAQQTALLGPPANEEERLAGLHSLQLLDAPQDPAFDRVTKKLTRLLDVPIALVTLVDRDRQFFASQTGLPDDLAASRETPREVSVCSQVVSGNAPLVVADLQRDRRFANNPLLREKGLRSYAGVPLRLADGPVLGSLCVLDRKPRTFSDREMHILQVSAEEVMEIIQARRPAEALPV